MRPVIAATLLVLSTGIGAAQAGADRGDATFAEILPLQRDAAEQRGQVDLRDIGLDEPILASTMQRLLAPPKDASTGRQSVALRRLHLDFERSADRLVIRNGSACHDAFALTVDGYMDIPAGDLHFAGVIWFPFDRPPLLRDAAPTLPIGIGQAARNGQNAGAPGFVPMGLSYRMDGASAAPTLRLNPFADAYPGALRRVAEACGRPDWQRP
jgi:hypothetical protein